MEQDKEEHEWLLERVRGAKSVLEIGSRGGASLESFASVCAPGAILRSIDIDHPPEFHKTAQQLIERGFYVLNLTLPSQNHMAVEWAWQWAPYDFVFIDGDHDDGVKPDWLNYGPMGKIVALHDIAHAGHKVKPLWEAIKAGHRTEEYTFRMGTGIVFTSGSVLR